MTPRTFTVRYEPDPRIARCGNDRTDDRWARDLLLSAVEASGLEMTPERRRRWCGNWEACMADGPGTERWRDFMTMADLRVVPLGQQDPLPAVHTALAVTRRRPTTVAGVQAACRAARLGFYSRKGRGLIDCPEDVCRAFLAH